MYIRKTKDEYHIQSNYGYGWSTETIEETYKEAKAQLKCYKENIGNQCDLRIKKVRIPV